MGVMATKMDKRSPHAKVVTIAMMMRIRSLWVKPTRRRRRTKLLLLCLEVMCQPQKSGPQPSKMKCRRSSSARFESNNGSEASGRPRNGFPTNITAICDEIRRLSG